MAKGQRPVGLHRAAHLARLRPAAASDGDIQALDRSGLRRQGARRRRPLRRAAGARHRAVRGREVPNSGARPQPADAADASRPGGAAQPRLQAPRHDLAVRRPRHRHRPGDRQVLRAPSRRPSSASSSTRSRPPCRDDLDVHLVMDNYATHKTPLIRNWLAKRPRWHVHLTPTSSSWLNQVERFFALLTEQQNQARHLSQRRRATQPTSRPSSPPQRRPKARSDGPNPPTISSLDRTLLPLQHAAQTHDQMPRTSGSGH